MSLGDQLRSAREKKGLTISDIARTTYIRAHYLEAIEQDDFSTIPPSRLRYFVQDYARSVDLDPVLLLRELPDDIPAPAPPPSVPSKPVPSRSVPFTESATDEPGKVAGMFGGEAMEGREAEEKVEEKPQRGKERERTKREPRRRRPRYTPLDQGNPALVRGLMTVAVLLLVGLGIYFLTGGFEDSGEEEGTAAAVADTSAGGNDTRILSRSENVPDTTAAAAQEGTGDSLTLQGRATAEVWYSIRMDNRQETGTLDSGEVKVWKAEKEFRVSLGNAGGLEFYLNGRSLGALGPKQTSLRNKVIDAQGIRASSTSRPRSTSSSTRARSSRRGAQQADPSPSRLRSLESTEPRRAVDPE